MPEPKPLEPQQQRVVRERRELEENITKLRAFTQLKQFTELHSIDQDLLWKQLNAMVTYSTVLQQLIDRWSYD